ncbi:MAG: response regulator [Piscinibacter sp.]|nr:response regulator [Piscinibacter sp.]
MSRPAQLRQRLLRQYLLLALLPLTLLTVLGTFVLVPALVLHGEERNRELASALRDQIELELEQRERTAEQLAAAVANGSIVASFIGLGLQSLIDADPSLQAAYVVDARGLVTHAALPASSGLHVADYIGLDESARPHFLAARRAGKSAWSNTLLSTITGQITLVLASPAGDSTVMIEFSLAGLSQALADMSRAGRSLTMVLDSGGRVIGHPDATRALRQENLSDVLLVKRAIDGQAQAGRIEQDGRSFFAYALPVHPIGWTVLVGLPTADVLAPLLRLAWLMLAILCVTGLGAVLAARWLAARAGQEVQGLAAGAQAAAAGKAPPALAFQTAEFDQVWGLLRSLFQELHSQGAQTQAARNELQAVLDAATEVAIIATDTEGRVTVFSVGAQKMLGYDAADVIGRATPALWHDAKEMAERGAELTRLLGQPVEGVEVFLAQTRRGGYEVRDWTFVRSDGDRLLVSLAITAVRDATGEVEGFLGVAVDITHRKRAEALEVAQRSAEASSQAKSEFLSRMSHELRSPLNAMLGYAQLLEIDRAEPPSAGQVVRLQQIQRAGWHLVQLIDDVLDLSRIESGQLRVSIETVDVLVVVARAAEIAAPLMASHGIALTQAWIGDMPASEHEPVVADATRLTQVIVNLLSNAAKYNRPGGSVRIECEPLPAGRFAVRVIDTGRGMSAEQVEQLFEPFNRLGLEGSAIEGTGIGLVITQRLVELMNGLLHVESEPGAGTTFSVILPRGERPLLAMPVASGPRVDAPVRQGRVLYIEDNEINAILMRELLLQRPGAQLHVAGTVEEGLAAMRSDRPDLVLLDMNLPDAPGGDVLDAMQADPDLRDIPVIVVSADATRLQVLTMLRRGVRAYLTKPFNVAEALAAIDAALVAEPARHDDPACR